MAKREVLRLVKIDLASKTMTEFRPQVFEFRSDSDTRKIYHVTNYTPHRFTCTYKDYLYRSHDTDGYSRNHRCKHIRQMIEEHSGKRAM